MDIPWKENSEIIGKQFIHGFVWTVFKKHDVIFCVIGGIYLATVVKNIKADKFRSLQ
jgi:hypothetical protein